MVKYATFWLHVKSEVHSRRMSAIGPSGHAFGLPKKTRAARAQMVVTAF
jgi:hypothetical protein